MWDACGLPIFHFATNLPKTIPMPPQRRNAKSIRGKNVNKNQYYLIKYSRSSLNIDTVFDRFREECKDVEIVEENHPQEGTRFLCLLHYADQQRRTTDYFKLNKDSANVTELKSKTDVKVQRHIIKTRPTAFRTNWSEIIRNEGSKWSELESATDYETGMQMARDLYPKDYILHHSRVQNLVSHYLRKSGEIERQPYARSSFVESEVMRSWFETNIVASGGHKKSLILWGRTRTGKTEWAQCLGKHWYMNGMWNIENFDCNVQYGVLDNMTFHKFRYFKELVGGQIRFNVSPTRRLFWGKPCIWLCNEDPATWKANKDMMEWVLENCEIEEVDNDLYDQD